MLAHEVLTGEAEPSRWMYFLHGILGRRQNWRAFARRWLQARTEAGEGDWGAVLVDLRLHGGSRDHADHPELQPHTVRAAAEDVVALAQATIRPITGISGHSFGAKVALRTVLADAELDHTRELWLLDAPVGDARHRLKSTTATVFEALDQLSSEYGDRKQFIADLEAVGVSRPTAQWLATNLEPTGSGGYRFPLDLPAIQSMLRDYTGDDLRYELSSTLELAPFEGRGSLRVGVVLGGRSDAVESADKEYYRSLVDAGQACLHTLERAGHWLHVDDAAGLLRVMSKVATPGI